MELNEFIKLCKIKECQKLLKGRVYNNFIGADIEIYLTNFLPNSY